MLLQTKMSLGIHIVILTYRFNLEQYSCWRHVYT